MRSHSATNGVTTARSARSHRSGGDGTALRWFDQSVCVFWLGEHCFGLQSALVGEVCAVESVTPVPMAPAAVLGLFNLRGTPVALVDLAQVLELPGSGASPDGRSSRTPLALVLRTQSLLVAAHISKMEVVVPAGRGLFSPPDEGAGEHPVVAGFLELPERSELTVTLLDPEALVARLDRLRYRNID